MEALYIVEEVLPELLKPLWYLSNVVEMSGSGMVTGLDLSLCCKFTMLWYCQPPYNGKQSEQGPGRLTTDRQPETVIRNIYIGAT